MGARSRDPPLPPTATPCILVQGPGLTQLFVLNADGTDARRVAEELDVRGAPAWSPDGQWLAVAANRDGEPNCSRSQSAAGRRFYW